MRKRISFALVVILLTGVIAVLGGCSGKEKSPEKASAPTDSKANEAAADKADSKNDEDEDIPGKDAEDDGDRAGEEHIVMLDPGHGGPFSGAANGSLVEKELTLKIGLLVKEHLEENYPKIKVYMTREDDTVFSDDVAKDLEERCEYAKEVGAQILVSLHLNASPEHNATGANVYISHRPNVTDESKKLGKAILEELSGLGIENGGTHTRNSNDLYDDEGKVLDYYAINRHCAARDIPGVIVEHCYIDAEGDLKYIDSDEALERLACADAEGIASYFYGE